MLELLKKENDVVVGYRIAKTKHDKKENAIVLSFSEFNVFKCVADHKVYTNMVQAVVTSREMTTLNSNINKLETKMIENLGFLEEKEKEKLAVYRSQLALATKTFEQLEIPEVWKNKHISEYPQQVLLLANWVDGIIPNFSVSKIKTLVTTVISELVETGKTDISDEKVKEVSKLLKETYAPIYDTKKDAIFKKWALKFDIKAIRQLILASGLTDCVKDGKFTYTTATEEKIKHNVAHALLRRMQKDNAQ